MIRNIIFSFLIFDLVLAFAILVAWQASGTAIHPIRIGSTLLPFFRNISLESQRVTWQIPSLEKFSTTFPDVFKYIISTPNILRGVLTILIALYDGLNGVLNFFIFIVNVILKVVFFLLIWLNNFENFVEQLSAL